MNLSNYRKGNSSGFNCYQYSGYFFVAILLLLTACNKTCPEPGPLKLMVLRQVHTLLDTSQSYSVYIPSTYDTAKSYPVIFAFDPHAQGDIPVRRLMTAAEKFGFIVAGSNNSYNTAPNIEYVINSFIYDVGKQFNIDGNRVYVCGFSGGARIATTMAFMSQKIRGVIACGAGIYFPAESLTGSHIRFYGMAGNTDFNYSELWNTGRTLTDAGVDHFIEFFNGGHEWPSDSLMYEAVLWLHIREMKDGIIPVDKQMLNELAGVFLYSIRQHKRKGLDYEAYRLSEKAIRFIGGMVNMKKIRAVYNTLRKNGKVKQAEQQLLKYFSTEQQLRNGYQQAIGRQTIEWWQREVKGIDEKIASSAGTEQQMYRRVKSFLGMLGYMHAKNVMQKESLTNRQAALELYEVLSPGNPDIDLLAARSFALANYTDSALARLNTAIRKGYAYSLEIREDSVLFPLYRRLNLNIKQ